jgi:hypothetical protein
MVYTKVRVVFTFIDNNHHLPWYFENYLVYEQYQRGSDLGKK